MTDESNANAPPPIDNLNLLINNFVWPMACIIVNGVPVSLPMARREHLMIRLAGLVGRAIGESLRQGNLSDVLQFRGAAIKAFTEGMREVKPLPMPTTQQPELRQ